MRAAIKAENNKMIEQKKVCQKISISFLKNKECK